MRGQLARMGEMYNDSYEEYIAQPDIPVLDEIMRRALVGSPLTTPQPSDQPNQVRTSKTIEERLLTIL
jgi:hypothetical protein